MRIALTVLCIASLAGAACSSGGDERAQTISAPAQTPSMSTATATPAASGTAPATPSSTAASVTATATATTTAGGLAGALLKLEDMPTGWSPDPSMPGRGLAPSGQRLPNPRDGGIDYQRAVFQRSADVGPFFAHIIARFPAGQAQQIIDDTSQILERCPAWEEVSEGITFQTRAAALSFPRLGDQTSAYRVTISGGGVAGQDDIVLIRRGDTLSLVSGQTRGLGTTNGFDPQQLEQLARQADAKLSALR